MIVNEGGFGEEKHPLSWPRNLGYNVVTFVVFWIVEFEWDPVKAASNLRKNRVSFEVAARVFLDPLRIEALDERAESGEERWKTVGYVEPALLVVVYTIRGNDLRGNKGETIRLISARKADAHERAQYREIQS